MPSEQLTQDPLGKLCSHAHCFIQEVSQQQHVSALLVGPNSDALPRCKPYEKGVVANDLAH